jgi:hypothetical protein
MFGIYIEASHLAMAGFIILEAISKNGFWFKIKAAANIPRVAG